MGVLKKINLRPMRENDIPTFNRFRHDYWKADLELAHGFGDVPGVESAVAETADQLIGALTATLAVVIDPFIKNPHAPSHEIMTAVFMLERALAYQAQKAGAVDAYIAIPDSLPEYQQIVQNAGYSPSIVGCKVYRRALIPDTQPLIGPERDKAIASQKEAEIAATLIEDSPVGCIR